MKQDIINQLIGLCTRLHENAIKCKYWVDKNGNKYPYYSPNTRLHSVEVKRYFNIESKRKYNGEDVYPLPKDGYPYTIEYSEIPNRVKDLW